MFSLLGRFQSIEEGNEKKTRVYDDLPEVRKCKEFYIDLYDRQEKKRMFWPAVLYRAREDVQALESATAEGTDKSAELELAKARLHDVHVGPDILKEWLAQTKEFCATFTKRFNDGRDAWSELREWKEKWEEQEELLKQL